MTLDTARHKIAEAIVEADAEPIPDLPAELRRICLCATCEKRARTRGHTLATGGRKRGILPLSP